MRSMLRICGFWLVVGAAVTAVLLATAGTTPAPLGRDFYGLRVRPASTFVNVASVTANTSKTQTAPTFAQEPEKRVLIIFADPAGACGGYWVNAAQAAAIPSGDVTDGSAAEGNPAALTFAQGATFYLITTNSCKVTESVYLLPQGT